jgi:hypothetical protein
MTSLHQERLKSLLGVMVRRHTRHGQPNHPVGQLIADEADTIGDGENGLADFAVNDELNRKLVDRLYRRFLLPRHETVEVAADNDTLILDGVLS